MREYSRRRLLGHGVAALAFAPSFARAAPVPVAPETPPPNGETIQGSADAQRRLTLDVQIDGKGPFRFMVDTGADQSVVSTEVALALGLINGDNVMVQDIARAVPAPTTVLENVSIGSIRIDSLTVPILPRQWLGADGYLGLDAVDGKKVTFDFSHDKLKVDESDAFSSWVHTNETVVRANGSNGRLTAVSCFVDGVRAYAFIDSGAQMSIGNTRLFAELQDRGAKYIGDFVVPVIGVTGGESPGRITAVNDIRLGSLNFLRSTLVIADLQVFDVWGLSDKPALFIGMNFLRQTSALTIDFGRRELRFKTADVKLASRA
ncbi:MAG: aspartyl protease family protein [Rhizomicrobium sp.]